jgi:hypothetical protein
MKRLGLLLGLVMVSLGFTDGGWAGRAWVSGSGSDSNACTLTAPCRSFGRAISVANYGDEIVVLDSGGYGAFTVNKSITISVPPGVYAGIIVSSGNGITINGNEYDVVILRGLTIAADSAGTPDTSGIVFYSGKALYVENCSIRDFADYGIAFQGNGFLSVKDTALIQNSNYGIFIQPEDGNAVMAILDRVRLEGNAFGLHISVNSNVTIRDSLAIRNSVFGFQVSTGNVGSGELNIENCALAHNGTGISTSVSSPNINNATIRVSNSIITNNTVGLSVSDPSGGGVAALLSRGNNTVEGNGTDGSFTGTFSAK